MFTNDQIVQSIIDNSPQLASMGLDSVETLVSSVLDPMGEFSNFKTFTDGLANKYIKTVVMEKNFKNRLAKFKKGKIAMGYTMEQCIVDVIAPVPFNKNSTASDNFKRYSPNIRAVLFEQYSEREYDITIDREQLRKAFMSENGLDNLITQLMNAPYVSNERDEYLIMNGLLSASILAGQVKRETVEPVIDKESTEDFLEQVFADITKVEYGDLTYNYANMFIPYQGEENFVLLVTPNISAKNRVQVMGKMYNNKYGEFKGDMIAVDKFHGLAGDVVAVLMDKNAYFIYDKLFQMTSQENPRALYVNYFLIVHQLLGVSPFANMVFYTDETGDAYNFEGFTIEPNAVSLRKTQNYQFQIKGDTLNTGNPFLQCTWSTDSDQSVTGTEVTDLGFITIGADETALTVVVTATSTVDPTKTAITTITILDNQE